MHSNSVVFAGLRLAEQRSDIIEKHYYRKTFVLLLQTNGLSVVFHPVLSFQRDLDLQPEPGARFDSGGYQE